MSDEELLPEGGKPEEEDEDTYHTPSQWPRSRITWHDIGSLTSTSTPMPGSQPLIPSTPVVTDQPPEPSVRPKIRRSLFDEGQGSSSSAPQAEQAEPVYLPRFKPRKPRRKPRATDTSGVDNPAYESDSDIPFASRPGPRSRLDSFMPESNPDLGDMGAGPSTPTSAISSRSMFASQVTPSPAKPVGWPFPPRRPIPAHRQTPTPKLVQMFRKGKDESPDIVAMKRAAEPIKWADSESWGWELAQRSKQNVAGILKWQQGKKNRKLKLLHSRFPHRDPQTKRYGDIFRRGPGYERLPSGESSSSSETDFSDSETRHLIPRTERDERAVYNPAYYRQIKMMGRRHPSDIMPLGRMDFGPIDTEVSYNPENLEFLSRRLNMVDDPWEWSHRERAFANRLRSLSLADIDTYRRYRDMTDPSKVSTEDQPVSTRLVRADSRMSILDQEKKRLGAIRRQVLNAPDTRTERSEGLRRRASLPLLMPSALTAETITQPPLESEVPSEEQETKYLKKKKRKKRFSKVTSRVKDCNVM